MPSPVDYLAPLYVARGEQAPPLARGGPSVVRRGQRLAVLALPVRITHRWWYWIQELLRRLNDLCVDLTHRCPVLDGGKGLVRVVPQWCAVQNIPDVVVRHPFPVRRPRRFIRVNKIADVVRNLLILLLFIEIFAYVRNLLLLLLFIEMFFVIERTENLVPPRGVNIVVSEYLFILPYISSRVEPPVTVQLPWHRVWPDALVHLPLVPRAVHKDRNVDATDHLVGSPRLEALHPMPLGSIAREIVGK